MGSKYIIIGSGVTGVTAAKSILSHDAEAEITMFGKEEFYPYNRVRLSKGLLSSLEEEKILLQKKEWFEINKIELITNTSIDHIDTHLKTVECSNGCSRAYDKLLIATGAKNSVPKITGIDKKNVFTLKTLSDAWTIMDEISNLDNILIIGGGIQGLETAWILSQMGKRVLVAEIQERLMPKQLDDASSHILLEAISKFNIEVLLNTAVSSITGNGNVDGFTTSSGDHQVCQGVIYSIGNHPNTEFLQNSGIDVPWGVNVDRYMRTNIEDVYAAGDVAQLNGSMPGLWNIAIEQGKTAGLNMSGQNVKYNHIVPVTRLTAFEISLFSMGDVSSDNYDTALLEEDSSKGAYSRIFIRDSKVVGAIMVGNIKNSPILKWAVESEASLESYDYQNVCISEFLDILKEIKSKK